MEIRLSLPAWPPLASPDRPIDLNQLIKRNVTMARFTLNIDGIKCAVVARDDEPLLYA